MQVYLTHLCSITGKTDRLIKLKIDSEIINPTYMKTIHSTINRLPKEEQENASINFCLANCSFRSPKEITQDEINAWVEAEKELFTWKAKQNQMQEPTR